MAEREKVEQPLAGCKTFKGKDLKLETVFAEKKLDGYRGVIIFDEDNNGVAYTHNGCTVVNAERILRQMKKSKLFLGTVLDGEFMCQGNWNDTGSVVMTQTEHPLAHKLVFNAFDMLSLNSYSIKECVIPLRKRKKLLRKLIEKFVDKTHQKCLSYVQHDEISATAKAINKYMKLMKKRGYEGCVVKDPDSMYAFKKSNDWLKVKPKEPADLKVVGITEGKGKFEGLLGALMLEGKIDGKDVKVNSSGMNDKTRKKLTKLHKQGKLVGHIVEIKHEGLTVNNAVRFPRFVRMRPDKD